MPTTENPTSPVALVVERGAENLAGKRLMTADLDEAVTRAEQIDGTIYALEPVEPNPDLMPPVRVVPASEKVHPITGSPWSQSAPVDLAPISSQAGLASFRRSTFFDGPEAA